MPLTNPSCAVALSTERNNATVTNSATEDATNTAQEARQPASLKELRAQLRAQPGRNSKGNREDGKVIELRMPESANATSWGWRVTYPNRDPVEVYSLPESTHAEMLRDFPGAIAAEPIKQTPRQPARPLTADEEMAIRTWLTHIKETDPYMIADVLEQCRNDADARDYFIGRAAVELPKAEALADDFVTCRRCRNLRGEVCTVASLNDDALVRARRGYCPERDRLQRCAGFTPAVADADRERGQPLRECHRLRRARRRFAAGAR